MSEVEEDPIDGRRMADVCPSVRRRASIASLVSLQKRERTEPMSKLEGWKEGEGKGCCLFHTHVAAAASYVVVVVMEARQSLSLSGKNWPG